MTLQGDNLLGPLIRLFRGRIVFLFINGLSPIGGLFSGSAMVVIAVGIIMNLRFRFKNRTLLSSLTMFALLAIGLGLTLKSLRSHRSD